MCKWSSDLLLLDGRFVSSKNKTGNWEEKFFSIRVDVDVKKISYRCQNRYRYRLRYWIIFFSFPILKKHLIPIDFGTDFDMKL